ncbi:quinone-dependent dihydroorotate dehydrogenase [Propionicicella superfundia]|uniref:quinone-dependent dihydroorotate dehydrogenase n=1 Tax=Propionicicella superfundia TaxID=348582 RepID=UPI000686977C|nr:quinone-dependent dihydroorotate dehydrogenase [Propionicicella superfundia]
MTARAVLLRTGYRTFLRPLLFRAHHGDPEAIHEDMITWLERLGASPAVRGLLRLLHGGAANPVSVAGVAFPGRVGVAAGLDKDGRAALAWQAFGFGFAELGTVTGLAQPGNDRPRVFRLRESSAIINRMGFNNLGARAMAERLDGLGVRRGNLQVGVPLGISLGKTKAVPLDAAAEDYLTSLRALAPFADYIAVNVSSPNTPGLRSLQGADHLGALLGALTREAEHLAAAEPLGAVPIFLKIAPDLSWNEVDAVLETACEQNVRGVIATNTTLTRHGLAPADEARAAEAGGLSGVPLTARAREVVTYITAHSPLPVIASGGIMSATDAEAMFDAGARLVELYTGFIYEGSGLIAAINALPPTRRTA